MLLAAVVLRNLQLLTGDTMRPFASISRAALTFNDSPFDKAQIFPSFIATSPIYALLTPVPEWQPQN